MSTLISLLVKAGAIASTVAGALTAAAHGLPTAESVILTAAGPVVFLFERYWSDVEKLV